MQRVAVFDSGVGGLSICRAIGALRPDLQLDYLADSALFPYGELPEQQLIDRVSDLLQSFCHQRRADLLVLACNTASTLALPTLRQRLTIPVVGVVPAIKPAAAISQSRVIGLLATNGTVQRQYTEQLIADFAADCTIIRIPSSPLVSAIELNCRQQQQPLPKLQPLIDHFMQHPQASQADTMVLACTHFPLVKATLAEWLPGICHWVDSGDAIAQRVNNLLAADNPAAAAAPGCFFQTLNPALAPPTAALLTAYGFHGQAQCWPASR